MKSFAVHHGRGPNSRVGNKRSLQHWMTHYLKDRPTFPSRAPSFKVEEVGSDTTVETGRDKIAGFFTSSTCRTAKLVEGVETGAIGIGEKFPGTGLIGVPGAAKTAA